MTDLVPARLPETAIVDRPTGPQTPPPMPAPDDLPLNYLEPVVGERQYVTNPHTVNTVAAAVTCVFAGAATVYAMTVDNPYVTGLATATFVLLAATIAFTRRFNTWDNDYSPADQA